MIGIYFNPILNHEHFCMKVSDSSSLPGTAAASNNMNHMAC